MGAALAGKATGEDGTVTGHKQERRLDRTFVAALSALPKEAPSVLPTQAQSVSVLPNQAPCCPMLVCVAASSAVAEAGAVWCQVNRGTFAAGRPGGRSQLFTPAGMPSQQGAHSKADWKDWTGQNADRKGDWTERWQERRLDRALAGKAAG